MNDLNTSNNDGSPLTPKPYDFFFTGSGSEYFRIWIVNILLTILTLGIYSAWAKVRTNRYFYGNAHLAQASFDYLASPITILKGRLIAVAIVIAYAVLAKVDPIFEVGFFLLIIAFLPWLIVKSLAFNAYNSAYRNIRFGFTGSMGSAFKEYIAFPLLIIFTLGLIVPYVSYRQSRFVADNHRFGDQYFNFNASSGDYYKIFAIVFAAMIAFGVVTVMTIGSVAHLMEDPIAMITAFGIYIPFIYLAFAVIAVYVQVKLFNLFFDSVTLGEHEFRASLTVGRMLWLQLSNLLAIIVTFGLFYPWAKVRMAKYRLEQLSFVAATDLDSFTAAQSENISAMGDEIGEAFAVEVGF